MIIYEIAYCLGYYCPGICGLVLFCLGLKAYCSDDKTVVEESVNVIPMPESEAAPVSIPPEETVPVFVAPPMPDAPPTYGGGVVFHDTHTIAAEYIVDTAATKPKKSKQRYCKYCGGAIDLQTKKCSGCGKQYFHIKSQMRNVVIAVIIACLFALNAFQFYQCWQLNKRASYYDVVVDALYSNDLGEASGTFRASRSYIIVGADEEDRRFTLTAHNLNQESITVSYSSDAATVSFDKRRWNKMVNVEVIPNHPGVTVVTFEDDKSGKSFDVLLIVTD